MGYQKLTILATLASVPAAVVAGTLDADSLRRLYPSVFQATSPFLSLDSL